ncbi:MAG: hypothetical protein IRY95_06855, partial [Clostridia bacterium]|nr:hypothetical protein [Clostridia bacterium]
MPGLWHPGVAALAGLIGGYAMVLSGYWLEGVAGLPRVDFAASGRRYVGQPGVAAWVVGLVFHLANSALLGLIYGAWFLPLWFRGTDEVPFAAAAGVGLAYGVAVFLVMAVGVVGA